MQTINKNQVGIGLRQLHYQQILDEQPKIDWLEFHAENFFSEDALAIKQLEKIRENYPLSMHGVGLSLGSADELNQKHLQKLKTTLTRFEPQLVSEHLSWSSINGNYFNDLLPLPYTQESLDNFVLKVKQTQDYLGQQILIENPSSYIQFAQSDMNEWDFYGQLPKLTGCGLLLDVNNVFVSAFNHKFDIDTYLNAIKAEDIQEIHLAGFAINSYDEGDIYIDDHGSKVKDEVWALYQKVVDKFAQKPTLIEWDTNIPKLSVLLAEAEKAKNILC
jgi:uncharacterized protein (UPF0276 family)